MNNSVRFKVAIDISSQVQPFVFEVTPVDEPTMRMRLKHTLGFICLVAMYAPIVMCETKEKGVLSSLGHIYCLGHVHFYYLD